MASLTDILIQQRIPEEMIALILMLPVIATIIAFARQIIGIRVFGLYIPLILTFSFVAMGIKLGVVVFITILISGTFLRLASKKIRLLYLPRMSLIIIISSLIIIFLFWLGIFQLNKTPLYPWFSLIFIIILLEKFLAAQIERGFRTALTLTLETLLLAIAGYYIITWQSFQNLVIGYPLIVIGVTILINIFLGKWTGLRISEYFRFKEAIKHIEIPPKK